METTEKIVEAYVRYVKGWATIRNIRCDGQYEKKHGEPPPCFTARNSRFLQLYYSCVCAQRARLALTTR
jgi:hypothetical protein